MFLIAQGSEPSQRWRKALLPGAKVVLGREAGPWSTTWDERISKQHIELDTKGSHVEVRSIPTARNPVYFRGRKSDKFTLKPGEHFVIGATAFTLVADDSATTLDHPSPDQERTFEPGELQRSSFRHPDSRITALARLPEIIAGGASEEEIQVRLVNVLMSGVAAKAVALVGVEKDDGPIEVIQWDRRMLTDHPFHPSERLIRKAMLSGKSTVHVWTGAAAQSAFTLSQGVDWAFCTPMLGTAGRGASGTQTSSACPRLAIYVTGSFAAGETSHDPELLRDDVKFTELVASTYCQLREAQIATRRQATLSQFLSPNVVEAISASDPEAFLAPREADVTVLFCDLRGFTSHSERSSANLFGLLERVSQALGVMTKNILEHGGVIGDFHGDSAMGFWGWPLAQTDAATRACQAALAIRREFADASGHASLADFRIGIGIASGRAVAGKIGTTDQVKVTVFGPVVNLASRLESLTKQVGSSILLDEASAKIVANGLSASLANLRRVGTFQIVGIASSIRVYELSTQPDEDGTPKFNDALTLFERGQWAEAEQVLSTLAEEPVARFVLAWMKRSAKRPPDDWRGIIDLDAK